MTATELDGRFPIGRDVRPGDDRPFLVLDAAGNWRLAYDALQWVIQKRHRRTAELEATCQIGKLDFRRGAIWLTVFAYGISFVHFSKAVVLRDIRECGIELTAVARLVLDAMPATFPEFLASQNGHTTDRKRRENAISPLGGANAP
jgi:hypothetical protein